VISSISADIPAGIARDPVSSANLKTRDARRDPRWRSGHDLQWSRYHFHADVRYVHPLANRDLAEPRSATALHHFFGSLSFHITSVTDHALIPTSHRILSAMPPSPSVKLCIINPVVRAPAGSLFSSDWCREANAQVTSISLVRFCYLAMDFS
jgi:hypothetical protein